LKKAASCGFLLFHAQTGALSPQPDGIGRFLAAHHCAVSHFTVFNQLPGRHALPVVDDDEPVARINRRELWTAARCQITVSRPANVRM